jgi:glycosyltransferase involved in cell wall biosynthesis
VRASWRARQAVRGVLAAHEQHVLLFHTQVTALFSPAIMRRVPAVVSLDATPLNYDSVGRYYGHRPAGDGFLDRQKYRLNRQVFHQAAALVAWSEWARCSLVEDYGVDHARTHVIAPGAAPEFFDLGDQRLCRSAASAALEGRTPDGEDRLVRLLFVGADFERKGGPLLLECMRQGLAERCELHVVTKTDVAPQPNVYVHRGIRPNSAQLYDLFAQADVFVLPSYAECLAIVLMEATAAGLPVVTTGVGALREAVVEGESGMVIPAGDVRALWHALTTLAGDRLLRRRMSVAGLTLARQKFDARRNNRALLDVVCAAARAGLLPHQARSLA